MKKVLFLTLCFLGGTLSAQGSIILIDPGHGGEDLGAMVKESKGADKRIYEKDLTLILSKKIVEKLKNHGHNVYLTRSFDRTVSLNERAEMAEKLKADLFISIHINSYFHEKLRGVETYYLDNHQDVAVKKVEQVENQALKGNDLVVQQILTDLIVERTVSSSRDLGMKVHQSIMQQLSHKYKLVNRGIRPGLFYVLALAKRPALLLEVGFLSNPKDLSMILGDKFQDGYSQATAKGILNYLSSQKKKNLALF
jgi:N-acetylmuramoyl-L-alanine amidase